MRNTRRQPDPKPAKNQERLRTIKDLGGGERGVATFVHMVVSARRGTLPAPVGDVGKPKAIVVVNHGRWLVSCPFCAGAERADPDDKRFYCLSCGNKAVGNKWIPVKWPTTRVAIEAELVKRPVENTRNWRPGETVAQLAKETKENM